MRWYASEELDTVAALDDAGDLAVAIDPLDGSSNIDVNVSIGTIFGFYPAEDDAEASFLRPGRDLRAAGYVIYGPQTALVASFGDGVVKFVLDRATGVFRVAAEARSSCRDARANTRSTPRTTATGRSRSAPTSTIASPAPRARTHSDFNMRWIASLVAEVHRIVTRGGVFLYPADRRQGLRARPPAARLRVRARSPC